MNGQRDIERTLEAWLLDGPSVMPDRAFDAVFDQVGRTPQRRLARLHLRLTDMNPRTRWLAAGAAGLVVVVVALAVINRPARDDFGASPSPTIGPASPGPVPAALIASWHGANRPAPRIAAGAGVALWFSATELWITQANATGRTILQSDVLPAGEGRFVVQTTGEGRDCPSGDAGAYTWSLSSSGRTLTLEEDAPDECAIRGATVPGMWWLVGCEDPNPEAACLGVLDAGDYSSEYFDPFVGVGGAWQARFGALGYTVPAGWSNTADWPESFNLSPPNKADQAGIYLHSDVLALSEDDPCGETPDAAVGRTAEEIATWIAGVPGIVSTTPSQVEVGGLDAWRLDLSVDPSWTTTCPFSDGKPYRGLLTDRPATAGFSWGLLPDTGMRLYLVDLGDDRALMVSIQADRRATLDEFVAQATTIVESFELVP